MSAADLLANTHSGVSKQGWRTGGLEVWWTGGLEEKDGGSGQLYEGLEDWRNARGLGDWRTGGL